jgi:hypothetical protein
VTWIDIVAGLAFLVSPLNMRYQFGRARRRAVEHGADLQRFDRFLGSRLVRAFYVLFPAVGIVLIVLGLAGA